MNKFWNSFFLECSQPEGASRPGDDWFPHYAGINYCEPYPFYFCSFVFKASTGFENCPEIPFLKVAD